MTDPIPTRPFVPLPWMADAACVGEPSDVFYPTGKDSDEYAANVQRAKDVCARCTVRNDCLLYGATDRFGIYGGLTPEERTGKKRVRPKKKAS